MNSEEKGMLSYFTIITSILTGAFFPLLGSLLAIDLNIIETFYYEGLILVLVGGFIAHWILAHSIHDYYHYDIEKRKTFSKKHLKIMIYVTIAFLLVVMIYLTIQTGWPVTVLGIIGVILCLYAEGLFHHESQMAFGAMLLVIGGFYVQVATLDLSLIIWLKVLSISLFAFFSQLGWLLFYRLDDYSWSQKVKIKSILIAKTGLIFLIIYFLL